MEKQKCEEKNCLNQNENYEKIIKKLNEISKVFKIIVF